MSGSAACGTHADRHTPVTPRQRHVRRMIRKEAARLFAEYGVGAVGILRVADAVRLTDTAVRRYYAGRRDLLLDVLSEYPSSLNEAISTAFDMSQAGPARLEAVIAAWLDHVAAETHEHRTLLFFAHLLPAEQRDAVALKHRILLETAYLAPTGAVPALAERPDLTEELPGTIRALLDDPTTWPEPEPQDDRSRRARRITGMLIAAASAETEGAWPRIGPTEAVSAPRRLVECSHVRARSKELDASINLAFMVAF